MTRALHAEGKVAAEIAVELGIAEKTVRTYLEGPEVPA
jgi:DNA-binding CsgD family transcriptional regulator